MEVGSPNSEAIMEQQYFNNDGIEIKNMDMKSEERQVLSPFLTFNF